MEFGPPDTTIGFVSTYPPTVCGLASYTASLVGAIAHHRQSRGGLGVVSLVDSPPAVHGRDVVMHHRRGDTASRRRAARLLNSYDTVSIQHEFGIFGGQDGMEVVDLMAEISVPTSVTFHTVLDNPTDRQRHIVEGLAESADRLVVMSQTASSRLEARYDIDPDRIEVIPHGADPLLAGPSLVTGDRPLVVTWGLIGPGKGLETAIAAFAGVSDLDPRPRYLIAGATHPNVRESSGESYRHGLMSLVGRLGLEDIVEFDDRYLRRAELAKLVRSADLVVLPYQSVEQVTSGVLVEAIAASKPVVATRFPHAVELLANGAGLTVPHDDPAAMAAALRSLLTDRPAMSEMAVRAGGLAEGWYWPAIGRRFAGMMTDITGAGSGFLAGAGVPESVRRAV